MQEVQDNKEVTVILTSCGRFDLLRITLESFMKHNTYDIKEFIIYEDSGLKVPKDLKDDYPFIKWVEVIEQTGQIEALDYLWTFCVNTPYAFCCEDDWEFLAPGFIEASMKIMEANPKVLMVWLKELGANNSHPVEWNHSTAPQVNKPPLHYGIFKTSASLWAWHRFNPSLKRKADYDLIAPFSKHTTFDKDRGWKSEAAISQVYNKLGFTAALLPTVYIKHLGEGRRCV